MFSSGPAKRIGLGASLAVAAILGPGTLAIADPPSSDVSSNRLLDQPGILHADLHGVRPPPDVAADGWVVADADTGDILAAKRATVAHPPASTLKVLTALSTVHTLDPTSSITAPNNVETIDGTRVGLVPGAKYLVRDVITAMLIASGNDAAETIAAAAGGDAATIAAMKAEAYALQANDTVPGTVSGLDAPGQHTTAYDLALFGRAAIDDPIIAPYLVIPKLTLRSPGVKSFQISTHNPLLGLYPGIIGVKAGYTTLAQATYIGAAIRGGHRILITLIDAYPKFEPAAIKLLDWGFIARGTVAPIGKLASPRLPPTPAPKAAAVSGATHSLHLASIGGRSSVRQRLLNIAASLAAIAAFMRLRVKLLRRRDREFRQAARSGPVSS